MHSYPNVGYESDQLPTKLGNVANFSLDAAWSVYPSSDYASTTDATALAALDTKADVALDMFLDLDPARASNASAANVEVMVWQAVWGGVWPIGYYAPNDDAPSYTLDGAEYRLFVGHNQQYQKQLVYSWVPAQGNLDSVSADVFPLVRYLYGLGNVTEDYYLGLVQFGSETVHATQNVTFDVQHASMSLDVVSSTARPTKTRGPGGATASSKGAAGRAVPAPTLTGWPVAAAAAAGMAVAAMAA